MKIFQYSVHIRIGLYGFTDLIWNRTSSITSRILNVEGTSAIPNIYVTRRNYKGYSGIGVLAFKEYGLWKTRAR